MATGDGKTLEALYLELGLDLSHLQADFLAADRSISENLSRLNREKNTIKLRMEADISGLDRVTDSAKILEVQEKALNQQLVLSKDKLALLEAAYKQVAGNQNSSVMVVQRAEQAFQKQRIEVEKLESQLKKISAQKISIDTTQLQEKIAQLNGKIQNVRLKAEIDVSKLQGANAAFDAQKIHIAAVTKEIELQRQKLVQLQETMYRSAKLNGGDSVQTLNIKSNVLQQIQEIQKLETKLKELHNTRVDLQFRADSFKQVEAQIHENISRLNAKLENIKVKTEIDISKLGAAASEFDKAKAHVQGLTQELDLQRQKLAELQKAMYSSAKNNGVSSTKTIGLQTEIHKQIQAIDQLKAKIDELNKIQPPKTNNLLSGYLNIKGDVAGKLNQLTSAFNGIKSASQSADGAITKTLEIIGAIPHPVGKAVAALVAIPLVIKGIESSLLEMAKPAIAGGDNFYVMSRGMQLSIADMAKLSTIAKVTGIDINEVTNSLRRFSMQMTKAGEKNKVAVQVLKRYGAEIYDTNGRVKDAIELSAELGKALKKAQEEGNGAAFRDLVGGKFWSADFITYLEDFADNVEQAKKVVKNGLANPTWAHAIQGEINTLNAQTAQLGGAFSAALMPVVAEIVPQMREQFGELTKIIAANKENIKLFGDAMALPVRILNELTGGVIKFSNAIDAAKDKETALGKLFESLGKYRDDISALMNVAPLTALITMTAPVPGTMLPALDAYRKEIEEFQKERSKMEEEAKQKDEVRRQKIENSLGLSGLSMEQATKLEGVQSQLDEERIKREQETADIIYKIHHTSYENSLHDLENWKAEQLRIIEETEEMIKNVTGKDVTLEDERGALDDNYAAKQIQLEEEKEARLSEIRQRIAAADKTEFENRMIAIEDEKDAWIQAGMEKAEAEQLAQQQLSNYVKNINQELSAQIQALNQNDLEKRLSQIEKEKQAWINKGADVAQAEQLAQEQIRQAYAQTEEKLNEIRRSVSAADNSELENKLANIEKEKQAWIQLGMEKAEAEELAQQKINKAYEENEKARLEAEENHAQAIANAYKDADDKANAAMEEAERKNEALRNEALNVLKQEAKEFEVFLKEGYEGLLKLIQKKSGINPDLAEKMTPENLEKYKEAKKKATESLLPNWKDPYSAGPVNASLPKNLNATADAAGNAAKNLNNLASVAGNATVAQDTPHVSTNPLKVYEQPDGTLEISNLKEFADAAQQSLNTLGEQSDKTAEQLSAIADKDYNLSGLEAFSNELQNATQPLEGTVQAFNEIPQAVQGITENLSRLELPQFSDTGNLFASMEPQIQDFTQQISNMGMGVNEVTVKLSDLSTILGNMSFQQSDKTASEERTPVEVNTTVQIDEAHAWDYDHIQELAEKVADILEPRIISAIGGDSNSY